MSDKPFKTYEELVVKLRDEKKLDVPDQERVIALLKKHSYFSLVSGYKGLFKQQSGEYIAGTTIEDLLALFEFDNHLRDIFFHNILIIEKHIKSLLSYAFVDKYGDGQEQYLNAGNFNFSGTTNEETYSKSQEVKKLILTFQKMVCPPFDHKYIKHQWDEYHNVPLWVAIKAVTFGSTSKMYSLCTQDIQISVSREFPFLSEDQLVGMLDFLTRVRNVCAHNERLYDFRTSNKRAIQAMPLHTQLKIGKTKSYYNKGQRDLFAAVVCFKYLLQTDEFIIMVSSIEEQIKALCKKAKRIPETKILSCMGFPPNWTDCTKY